MVKTKSSTKKPKLSQSFDNKEELDSEIDCKKTGVDGKNNEDEKRFMCVICDRKFKFRHHYNNHARIHTGERPYSCKICSYKCKQDQQLRSHMKVHTGEKPHKCKFCDYESSSKGTLTNHMKTHTGVKPFKCMLCDYRCTQKQHLQIHLRIHLDEKLFECHLCGYRTTRKEVLTLHVKSHTGKTPFSCEFCNLQFYTNTKLQLHLEMHSEEPDLKGGKKRKGTKLKRPTKRLKKSEERLDDSACKEIMEDSGGDLKYRNNSQLQEESNNIETNEGFDNQASRLENHQHVQNTTSEESDEEVLACKICEEEFQDESKMREHLRSHIADVLNLKTPKAYESAVYNCLSGRKSENMYSCEICREKFVDAQSLQNHLTMHVNKSVSSCRNDDTELLNCDLCDLTFYDKSELKNHLDEDHRHNETDEFKHLKNQVLRKPKMHSVSSEQHLGSRSVSNEDSEVVLACKICEEEILDEDDLPNHLKAHERESRLRNNLLYLRKDKLDTQDLSNQKETKLYSCSVCNKKFLHKRHCRDHVKAHLNEKLYECYYCDYTSSQKENLPSHVKTHFKEEVYECSNCSYKCQHKEQLDNHLKSHWLENSSKFDVDSLRKDELSSQEESLEETPFLCKVCDEEFSSKQQFYDHERIHNRKKLKKRGKYNSTFNMD